MVDGPAQPKPTKSPRRRGHQRKQRSRAWKRCKKVFAPYFSMQRHLHKKRKCDKKALAEQEKERSEAHRLRERLRYMRLNHELSVEELESNFEDASYLPVVADAIDLT
jgi:hypothetical protein